MRKAPRPAAICACHEHAFVTLTKGYVCFFDSVDLDVVSKRLWRARLDHGNVYAQGKHCELDEQMHRVIAGAPPEYLVDHIDHYGLNNRRSNLRLASRHQNAAHMKRVPSGVQKRGNKWAARINVNNKVVYLGSFATVAEAVAVRNAKAVELHGEFACFAVCGGEDAA